MYRVGIIGTGVVGSALALLMQQNGHLITGVCSRQGITAAELAARIGCPAAGEPIDIIAEPEIVFLTVPDRELPGLAELLAQSGRVRQGQIYYHTSGALPAEILQPLADAGAVIASMHPLQSFASIDKAMINISGALFAFQGDPAAKEPAFQIIAELGGTPFLLNKDNKALYHLGACAASNYLVSLIHYAVSIYEHIGMSRQQAIDALMPLVRGTTANIEALGPVDALTGPIARGDAETVERHCRALDSLNPDMGEMYKILGRYTVGVALAKGSIKGDSAQKLTGILGGVNEDARK